jgi:hypothetical protein
MAIGTYAQLQTAIANWINRADLTARIPEFIALGEARLNRNLRLRMMGSDQSLTGSVGSRAITLPSGFLEPMNLWQEETTGRRELRFVLPELMTTNATDGQPDYWTVDGANVKFERELDEAYSFTLRMLQSFALSDSATTNWLLTNYPDAYLAASLAEAFTYVMDAEREAYWLQRYRVAVDEINDHEARTKAGATLSVDLGLLYARQNFDIYRG